MTTKPTPLVFSEPGLASRAEAAEARILEYKASEGHMREELRAAEAKVEELESRLELVRAQRDTEASTKNARIESLDRERRDNGDRALALEVSATDLEQECQRLRGQLDAVLKRERVFLFAVKACEDLVAAWWKTSQRGDMVIREAGILQDCAKALRNALGPSAGPVQPPPVPQVVRVDGPVQTSPFRQVAEASAWPSAGDVVTYYHKNSSPSVGSTREETTNENVLAEDFARAFACCGGNDETPQGHCADCPEHPSCAECGNEVCECSPSPAQGEREKPSVSRDFAKGDTVEIIDFSERHNSKGEVTDVYQSIVSVLCGDGQVRGFDRSEIAFLESRPPSPAEREKLAGTPLTVETMAKVVAKALCRCDATDDSYYALRFLYDELERAAKEQK